MSESTIIDARGLSCPEPVLLTQDALRTSAGAPFTVMVSSPTARDNVERALQAGKRKFTASQEGDDWRFEVQAG